MMDGTVYIPLATRGVLSVSGPDARSFLQGMVSNDMEKVDSATAIYAGLLSPQGKFLHDFFIAMDGDAFLLDCERDRMGELARRLTMFRLRAKADIADRSEEFSVMAVVGAGTVETLGLAPERGRARPFGGGIAFVDPRLADLGARTILPADTAVSSFREAGLEEGDLAAYEKLRLSLGIPDGSRDIVVDRAFLLESNFEELHGVDFTKGCYVGQENTSRQKYRGTVRKRLPPVRVDGPLPEPGTPVLMGEKEVGTIRSGFDGQAMALLRLEYVDEAKSSGTALKAGEATVTPVPPAWAS
ncbi:MAG: glycine cleavage system protein T [Rhodospirillaceae bacterium]|nr:glycine cleavage system protein T [Rhodospirillaceae bacterium]